MVGRVGIEPTKAKPKDLQSSPFDHSGTDPNAARLRVLFVMEPLVGVEPTTYGLQDRCSTN
jgi:hypothetical protein